MGVNPFMLISLCFMMHHLSLIIRGVFLLANHERRPVKVLTTQIVNAPAAIRHDRAVDVDISLSIHP